MTENEIGQQKEAVMMSNKASAKLITKIILPLALLISLAPVQAATSTFTFTNGSAINSIYFWADSPATTLTLISLTGNAAGWTEFSDPLDLTDIFLSGAPAGPIAPFSGQFRIQFDYPAPSFSFQFSTGTWVGNTYTQASSGTRTWGPGFSGSATFTHAGDVINPAPVAIPSSLYLLGSAFAGMLMLQRRRDGDALTLAQTEA